MSRMWPQSTMPVHITQFEKHAAAPDAQNRPAGAHLLDPKLDEVVENRPGNKRFKPVPYQNIGRRFTAVPINSHTDREVGAGRDGVFEVGSKNKRLITACSGRVHRHRDEWRVIDFYPAFFDRSLKPEIPGFVPFQDCGKQLYHLFSADR